MVGGSRKFLYFLFFFRGQLCMQCGNMYINGSYLPDQENELLIRVRVSKVSNEFIRHFAEITFICVSVVHTKYHSGHSVVEHSLSYFRIEILVSIHFCILWLLFTFSKQYRLQNHYSISWGLCYHQRFFSFKNENNAICWNKSDCRCISTNICPIISCP